MSAPKSLSANWRQLWQAPTLLLAGGVLIAGVVTAILNKPKPNYEDTFARAEGLLKQEKFGEAVDALTRDVGPHAEASQLTPKQVQKYHTLLGRSLSMGQRALRIDREENNRSIVAQYEAAEKSGAVLDPYDIKLLADSMVSLGHVGGAVKRADSLKEKSPSFRVELYQRMIERAMEGEARQRHGMGPAGSDAHGEGPREPSAHGEPTAHAEPSSVGHGEAGAEPSLTGFAAALELIGRLTADANLSDEVRVWTAAKQSEILLEQGLSDQAERRLQQTLLRVQGVQGRELAEMLVLLARAYMDRGDLAAAQRQLDVAAGQIGSDDPMMGEVLVTLAKVDSAQGEPAKAEEKYQQVVSRFPSNDVSMTALWGLARVQAEQGQDEEAIRHYGELIDKIHAEGPGKGIRTDLITDSLLSHFKDRYDSGDAENALRYASLGESLAGEDGPSALVLHALAVAHQRLGEKALEAAEDGSAMSLARADPATAAVAREHFIRSGTYFRQHAQRVVVDDNDSYGTSLWLAAGMFDRAGDMEQAIESLRLFVSGFPTDTRLPEAKFKLAEAYFATGDVATSQKLYRELLEGRGQLDGSGVYGDASVVPLAKTLLADADAANDEEAEHWLVRAVSGEFGAPTTTNYRAGLDELARLYYRTGRFIEAIERLTEFVERYGGDEHDGAVRLATYRLADARRQFASMAKERLAKEKMPDADRNTLERDRESALRDAMGEFEQVRKTLEDEAHRTPLEDTCLRNTHFYLGECAFELKEYDEAIRHYAAAKERYARDPASLVAMIQIVGAYQALGEVEKARTANARARAFFESLPEEVWNDPTLPMGRDAWKRWLDSSLKLDRVTSGTGGGE